MIRLAWISTHIELTSNFSQSQTKLRAYSELRDDSFCVFVEVLCHLWRWNLRRDSKRANRREGRRYRVRGHDDLGLRVRQGRLCCFSSSSSSRHDARGSWFERNGIRYVVAGFGGVALYRNFR